MNCSSSSSVLGSGRLVDSSFTSPSASASAFVSPACCSYLETYPSRVEAFLARSGRDLPFDVGMYTDCIHLKDAAHFLATFLVRPGSNVSGFNFNTFFPIAELGVCMPAACSDDDVAFVVKQILNLVDGKDFNRTTNNNLAFLHGTPLASLQSDDFPPVALLRDCDVQVTSQQNDAPSKPDSYGVCAMTVTALLVALSLGSAVLANNKPASTAPTSDVEQASSTEAAGERQLREPLLAPSEASSPPAPPAPPAQTTTPTSPQSNKVMRNLVKCFDISYSFQKMTAVPAKSPTDCLNGMRVLSMLWIIMGHTFMMPAAIAGFDNPLDVLSNDYGAKNSWKMQAILGGEMSVDTFFMMSGFLFIWVCYPQAMKTKSGRLPYAGVVAHRYMRITPALSFCLMLYYKVFAFYGNGPFNARYVHSINRRCDTSWWTELLYIQNFYPWNSDDVCMGWTWYLGNDFIFFLVSPLFLMLFTSGGMAASPRARHSNAVVGTVFLVAAIVGCTIGQIFLVYRHNLGVNIFDSHYARYTYWSYNKPYTRFPAWGIGMLCALFCKLEFSPRSSRTAAAEASSPAPEQDSDGQEEEQQVQQSYTGMDILRSVPSSWHHAAVVLAAGTMAYIVLIVTEDFKGKGNNWSVFQEMLWLSFARPMWALCCGVVTLSCATGHVPLVSDFLGHPIWVVPARLTFNAYLVHPIIIKCLAGNMTNYYHFSFQDVMHRWCGNSIYSFALAACVFLLVERPCMSFQTLLMSATKRRSSKRTTASAQTTQ
ncbi:acyltransferase 3 domain-containing protein [Pseudoscourfieldia marina]